VGSKKDQIADEGACFLEPREMVWVLSQEEFNMPANVTGIATLKTAFTKDGILALNVGIIDPLFKGPISTALINFSDRPRPIKIGDRFFRLIFFEHDDVESFHLGDESINRDMYLRDLKNKSYADFAPSFLNIPSFDDKYYTDKFWGIIGNGIWNNKSITIPALALFAIFYVVSVLAGIWDICLGEIWMAGRHKKALPSLECPRLRRPAQSVAHTRLSEASASRRVSSPGMAHYAIASLLAIFPPRRPPGTIPLI
jgi:dUTPase